jgi:hypothetical protein
MVEGGILGGGKGGIFGGISIYFSKLPNHQPNKPHIHRACIMSENVLVFRT